MFLLYPLNRVQIASSPLKSPSYLFGLFLESLAGPSQTSKLREMKKVVLKVDIHDERDKQKAMKAVSGLSGINSMGVDIKEQKMTIIGEVDPVDVVGKLKKNWYAEILTVGPPQEEKKKEEAKKDETKKEGEKKKDPNEEIAELVKAYKAYNPRMTTHYHVVSWEEDPNACVIL